MRFTILVCLCILLGASCANNSSSNTAVEGTQKTEKKTLPGLETAYYINLVEKCDNIDYIFHELPISMSQDERSSIVANLKHISSQAVETLNPDCKSIARIMYAVQGEIVTEAELYFSNGCTYFVFLENEKPFAANLMTQEAAVFYNNILKQISSGN